jgi:hypothetical protein
MLVDPSWLSVDIAVLCSSEFAQRVTPTGDTSSAKVRLVADWENQIGDTESVSDFADKVRQFMKSVFDSSKLMLNLCDNRVLLEVITPKGKKWQKLSFKAAKSYGNAVRHRWVLNAFTATPYVSNVAKSRILDDLERGLISRREATFLGVQLSLCVSTRFKALLQPLWHAWRANLFKEVYESASITSWGKSWKKFSNAIGNHLLENKLLPKARGQLEEIIQSKEFFRQTIELLVRAGTDILGPLELTDRMWLVSHLSQTRFLPGPSRKECLADLISLKSRLCMPRDDNFVPTKTAFDSFTATALTVGQELTGSKRSAARFKEVTQTHLSLSNSASLEYKRTEGGKLAILWNEFNEFVHEPISKFFHPTIKDSSELSELIQLQENVNLEILRKLGELKRNKFGIAIPVAIEALVQADGSTFLGVAAQEYYLYGDQRLDRRILDFIETDQATGISLSLPPFCSLKEMQNAQDPISAPVFSDFPSLCAFVTPGIGKAFAFSSAMKRLNAAIDRLKYEQYDVWDPLGNLICKADQAHYPIWKMSYLNEPLPFEKFTEPDTISTENGQKVIDISAGVDARLGRLLFLWSYREYLEWKRLGQPALPIDPIPISEPGVKARVATKSMIWINLFLSPASHFIKDCMLQIPGCRVGLQGSDHAWNYEASWARHCDRWRKDQCTHISTSDLTAATDYLDFDLARSSMKAFLDGALPDLGHGIREYLDASIDLNASSRLLLELPSAFSKKGGIRNRRVYKTYSKFGTNISTEFRGKTYRGCPTVRGVLMGEPLTKMILSLFSICAERCARANPNRLTTNLREFYTTRSGMPKAPRHHYACAGDDHVGIGNLNYLSRIPKNLQAWSGVISWDKYCISEYGAHYCQNFLRKPEPGQRYALRPQNSLAEKGLALPVSRPKYKVDHIMLRLLSDRRKVGSAVFEETNPFPGKSKQLSEELSWQEPDLAWSLSITLLQSLGLGRWFPKDYLKDPRSYIPQWCGGRGLTRIPGVEYLLSPSMRYCIVNNDDPAVRIAFGSANSRKVRGLILNESDVVDSKLLALDIKAISYDEAIKQVNTPILDDWSDVSYTQTAKTLRELFVPYDKIDLTEKKIAVATKAFSGPSKLKETQKSYESRMRAVSKAVRIVHEGRDLRETPTELVTAALQPTSGPWRNTRYIRRELVEAILPIGWIPSFTIPVSFLNGRMSRIELEERVVTPIDTALDEASVRECAAFQPSTESVVSSDTGLVYPIEYD